MYVSPLSEVSVLPQAGMAVVGADDHVVENLDAKDIARLDQTLGEFQVLAGWGGISARVVPAPRRGR